MGTSKGYQAPKTPQWSHLKGSVTRLAGSSALSSSAAQEVIRGYIQANGGASGMTRGGSGGSGPGAAVRAGRNLAGFATAVAERGLEQALRERGLEHLIGKPPEEFLFSLVDELCDSGDVLDEGDARRAMLEALKELLEGAQTYEEVQQILSRGLDQEQINSVLERFFGCYLYISFARVFFERLAQKHGEQKAKSFLGEIRRYIREEFRLQTQGRDLARIAWRSPEGLSIMNQVVEDTWRVYGS